MTEVLKDQNAWILKDGDVGDYLRPAFDVYGHYLAEERFIDAGNPLSNDKPENTDKIQLKVLNELGIKTPSDLMCLLNSNGITKQQLQDLQTPYLAQKTNEGWCQVKNPKYNIPIEGITFDDKYAIDHFMEILPIKNSYFSCKYTVDYMKDYLANQNKIEKQNKLIDAYEEIIKQSFNGLKNTSLENIVNGSRLPVDHIFLGEVIEVEKSLVMLCMEKANDPDFKNILIEWYLNMKKSCTRLNFYF